MQAENTFSKELLEIVAQKLHCVFFKFIDDEKLSVVYFSDNAKDFFEFTEPTKSLFFSDFLFNNERQLAIEQLKCNNDKIDISYNICTAQGQIILVREQAHRYFHTATQKTYIEGFIEKLKEPINEFGFPSFYSLQRAVNQTSVVSITNVKGVITFANDNFCTISGYTRDELIGNTHKIVNSGAHNLGFFTELWSTILRGEVWRGEIKNKAKNGSFYWVDSIMAPIYNAIGEISGFLSIRNLITDKVLAREALQNSDALNRGVLDSIHSNIIVINREGLVVENNKWKDISNLQKPNSWPFIYLSKNENYFELCKKAAQDNDNDAHAVLLGLFSVFEKREKLFYYEYQICLDGQIMWFQFEATLVTENEDLMVLSHHNVSLLKQHEKELIEKNTSIDSIIETNPGILYKCELKPPWRTEKISKACTEITGYSPEEFLSNSINWSHIVHPDDINTIDEAISTAIEQHETFKIEYRIITRCHEVKWVYEVGKARYAHGEPICLEGNILDITSRKLAEKKVEESLELFRNLLVNVPGVYWINDPIERKTLYISPSYETVFGQSCQSLLENSASFLDVIHPDDFEYIKEQHQKILEKGQGTFTYRIFNGEKRLRWISIKIKVSKNEIGLLREYGYAEDITELIENQNKSREGQIYLQAVFNTVKDAIITVGIMKKNNIQKRIITGVNTAACQMLGYAESELIGSYTEILFADYTQFEAYSHSLKGAVLRDGGKIDDELKIRKKDGTTLWCEIFTSKLEYNNTKSHAVVSVLHDITERRQKDLELKHLVEDLTHRISQNQQFNYILSHNLRAPLSNILGLNHLYELTPKNDVLCDRVMEGIKKSANKIDDTMNDLNLIMATQSNLNAVKEWVDINECINNQLVIVKVCAEQKLFLKVVIGENAKHIFTLKSYFDSIIYNLLSNAFKYSHPSRDLEIGIDVLKSDFGFELKIGDNGLGIDLKKYKNDLFGLYKRFNTDKEGKGLGLHMVKTQIEALGGKIEVESALLVGTTFTIFLPA